MPKRRPNALDRQIAASVDATPDLLPILPELLAGLDALGSRPARIATLLARAGVGPGDRVLDLACGKGAVAVLLARRLGCRVVGVDAFAPFVRTARDASAHAGLSGRCMFKHRDAAAVRGRFDAAVMAGLWGIDTAAPMLRARVVPGGVYVIDDALRDPRHPAERRFRTTPTLSDARALIEGLGDTVLSARMLPRAAVEAGIRRTLASLNRAGRAAIERHPQLAPAIRAFLRRQAEAEHLLAGPIRPVLVSVRRG